MTPPVRLARTAGLYYLVVAVLGGFAHVVRTQVYVAGDAAATLQNVTEHSTLVRLSFVADLASATFMVFLVLALYRLLGDVDRPTARLMVTLVTVFVGHHQPEHGEPVRGACGRHRPGVRLVLRRRRRRRDGAAADGARAPPATWSRRSSSVSVFFPSAGSRSGPACSRGGSASR